MTQETTSPGVARFGDAHADGVYLEIAPQETGNVELTVGREDGSGLFIDLPARDRKRVAGIIAGESEPVQNPGSYRIMVDTGTADGTMSPEECDRLISRLAWHLRRGIPGMATEGPGSFSINEVAEDDGPLRSNEVRRHFRYRVVGDGPEDWRFHRSFAYVRAQKPVEVQFQRTYKSDWEQA